MVRSTKRQIFMIRKIKHQKKWSKEEDKLLISLAQKYKNRNWNVISSHFPTKNYLQCFSRYRRIKPGMKRGPWNKEEDQFIFSRIQEYGKNWAKISKEMGTRNSKQIRDRYINVLDPYVNKRMFTPDEDNTILDLFNKYGAKWARIASHFTFRTADMVKNRFYSSISKRMISETNSTIETKSHNDIFNITFDFDHEESEISFHFDECIGYNLL